MEHRSLEKEKYEISERIPPWNSDSKISPNCRDRDSYER